MIEAKLIFAIVFLISITISVYLIYRFLLRKGIIQWKVGHLITLCILAPTMLLSGLLIRNVVIAVFGTFLLFGGTSLYLTSFVKNDRLTKRALEITFLIVAFGTLIYGYATTSNLVLGIIL
ncbi:MAG: hypothetical protein QXM86_02060, partial [Candidatus Bathyarchaeia archaeon]